MKRLLLLLALVFPAFAARTTVTGTLQLANGNFCSGTLSISNPPFTNSDGFFAGGTFTTPINATNGSFSVSLEPGPYYTVTYVTAPSGCAPPVEFWSVPTSGTPVDVSAVRSVAPPPPLPNTIPLTYITQSGATTGQCATWNGTNWAPAACSATSGTVTSVGLVGTTNQITVTGASPITGTGTWTLSLPSSLVLPSATTGTTQSPSDNSTKIATTAYVDNAAGCPTCVTAASTLTNAAIMAGSGSRGAQTPSATATLSGGGNISTPGTIAVGVGSGNAGAIELTQGSAPSLGSTSVILYAPASVTSYALVAPAAAATGVLHATNAANIDTLSISSVVSADLNLTTTTCTNQFLTAIGATGLGTCTTDTLASAQHANQGTTTTLLHGNAAGNPSWAAVSLTADVSGTLPQGNGGTGITSLGTGVATALGTAVSGTGAICLASGSACSGGATNITVGSSTITSGTDKRILYDNAGVLGEYTIEGNSTTVQMFTGSAPATNDCAKFDVNHNITGAGAACASGVTTNSPLSGTTTLSCTTCVVASSPGVGIAHFAGSTQTVTSSLIVASDITSATITGTQIASSVALAGSPTTTTQTALDASTKIATTAYVDRCGGAAGTAFFSPKAGNISGLTTCGVITGVTYTSTGIYSVTLTSPPTNQFIAIGHNYDGTGVVDCSIDGSATSIPNPYVIECWRLTGTAANVNVGFVTVAVFGY